MIPPVDPSLKGEELEQALIEIGEVLSSGILTGGPKLREFEERMGRYLGRGVVAMSSGALALEAVFSSLPGRGRVVMSTNTFVATFNAAVRAGMRPVLVDVDEFLGPDPEQVNEVVGDRTSAIVVTHIGGLVSPGTREILEIGEDAGVPVIEDFSHAVGSVLDGVKAGTFGAASAASLYATKVLTSGEGGIAVSGDPEILRKLILFRDNGKDPEDPRRSLLVGTSARMPEVSAVIALYSLSRLEREIAGRAEIAAYYDRELDRLGIGVQPRPRGLRNNWYKYIVRDERAGRLKEALREHGVKPPSGVYEVPLHRQPAVREVLGEASFPRAEEFSSNHLCLPIYSSLGTKGAKLIVAALEDAV